MQVSAMERVKLKLKYIVFYFDIILYALKNEKRVDFHCAGSVPSFGNKALLFHDFNNSRVRMYKVDS